jgi:hypothetical protein
MLYIVLILCVEYVTSRRYSAVGVSGRISGLRSHNKWAESK